MTLGFLANSLPCPCHFSYLFHFQKEIAKLVTLEQGKTLADAEGDVFRGLRKLLAPFKWGFQTCPFLKVLLSNRGSKALRNVIPFRASISRKRASLS